MPTSPILLLLMLSFFPSLIILTIYFSSVITVSSTKHTFHRNGFIVSLSGLAIGVAFALAAPLLPDAIPVLNVGIILTVITWVSLLRHYCETNLLDSLSPAIVAAILYIVILAIASAFTIFVIKSLA